MGRGGDFDFNVAIKIGRAGGGRMIPTNEPDAPAQRTLIPNAPSGTSAARAVNPRLGGMMARRRRYRTWLFDFARMQPVIGMGADFFRCTAVHLLATPRANIRLSGFRRQDRLRGF
jgi:hypothetical protein